MMQMIKERNEMSIQLNKRNLPEEYFTNFRRLSLEIEITNH